MSGRLDEAQRLLREAGFELARVEARGRSGEVAALRAPPGEWEALLEEGGAELVRRIRELGFRYVALDLDPASDEG